MFGSRWSNMEVIRYLAGIRKTLSYGEMVYLEKEAIFSKEERRGEGDVLLYKACALYEPNATFRNMRLDVLGWPTTATWRRRSTEGALSIAYAWSGLVLTFYGIQLN